MCNLRFKNEIVASPTEILHACCTHPMSKVLQDEQQSAWVWSDHYYVWKAEWRHKEGMYTSMEGTEA